MKNTKSAVDPQEGQQHSSSFTVTIVLNSTVVTGLSKAQLQEKKDRFKKVLDIVFNGDNVKKYLLKPVGKRPDDFHDQMGEVKTEYGLEVGETKHGKRLHTHMLITMTGNKCKVHLRSPHIKKILEQALGQKIYFHVKARTPNQDNFRKYLQKDGDHYQL